MYVYHVQSHAVPHWLPQGVFDLGYDYTFLCALHPDMRKDWATAWAQLLRPGGYLLTLIFPVDPEMDQNKVRYCCNCQRL